MTVMLDFIRMGIVELQGREASENDKMIKSPWDSNTQPSAYKASALST